MRRPTLRPTTTHLPRNNLIYKLELAPILGHRYALHFNGLDGEDVVTFACCFKTNHMNPFVVKNSNSTPHKFILCFLCAKLKSQSFFLGAPTKRNKWQGINKIMNSQRGLNKSLNKSKEYYSKHTELLEKKNRILTKKYIY